MLLSACSAARPCWGGLWLEAASAGAVPRIKPDCTELHLSPRTPSPAIRLCKCAGVHFKQLFDWIGAGGLSIAPRPAYECAVVNNGAKGALLCDSKLASATPHDLSMTLSKLGIFVAGRCLQRYLIVKGGHADSRARLGSNLLRICDFDTAAMYGALRRGCTELQSSS